MNNSRLWLVLLFFLSIGLESAFAQCTFIDAQRKAEYDLLVKFYTANPSNRLSEAWQTLVISGDACEVCNLPEIQCNNLEGYIDFLDVRNKGLSSIPPEIAILATHSIDLLISENEITCLPSELGSLCGIAGVFLTDANPITEIINFSEWCSHPQDTCIIDPRPCIQPCDSIRVESQLMDSLPIVDMPIVDSLLAIDSLPADSLILAVDSVQIVNTSNPSDSMDISITCETITVVATDTSTIVIDKLIAPIAMVQILNSNGRIVYNCIEDCDQTTIVPLEEGKYIVSIRLFTSQWHFICSTKEQITITASIVNMDTSSCTINGGILSGGPYEFCVADGLLDTIAANSIYLKEHDGPNNQWVLTDATGELILGLPVKPSAVDFDKTPIGTCLLWHLSYDSLSLSGLQVGGQVAAISGCFDWSNSIRINRVGACADNPISIATEEQEVSTMTCSEMMISYGNGIISIHGNREKQYFYKIELLSPSWQSYLDCTTSSCGSFQELKGLPDGRYLIRVWSANWETICEGIEVVLMASDTLVPEEVVPDNDNTEDQQQALEQYMCGEVRVNYGAGRIHIKGIQGHSYFFKLLKWFDDFQYVLNCTKDCGQEVDMNNLESGTYGIQIFHSDWTPVCDAKLIDLRADSNDLHIKTDNILTRHSLQELSFLKPIQRSPVKQSYSLFPNPTQERVYIHLAAYAGQQGHIQLFNQARQLVKEIEYKNLPNEAVQLEVADIVTGIYFLQMTINQELFFVDKLMIY